ncbi:hypothetical protein X975_02890, partial [Stegodyphus mimosarum]
MYIPAYMPIPNVAKNRSISAINYERFLSNDQIKQTDFQRYPTEKKLMRTASFPYDKILNTRY